jgi:hypothetical protein
MITTDLNSKITAATLNENMFKKFGTRVNFDKYTREELENYRNLLRTNIHQVETTSNFNDLLSNENYQKDKYMISVLNTKIKEMLGESKLLSEKSTSEKQARTMAAAAHDPKFAKKVGIKQSVAKEFNKKDKGTKMLSNAMKKKHTKEGVMSAVKAVGKKVAGGVNKLVGHGSDEEMIKDLQRKTGVPQTGKKPTTTKTPKESIMRTTEAAKKKGKPEWLEKAEVKAELRAGQKVSASEKKKVGATESSFPTVASAKARAEKEKTTGRFDKKKNPESGGTIYTRKSSTFTNGTEDKPKKDKDVKEYFYYDDDKKGGRSNPSQDKLAHRGGKSTPAGDPQRYKSMVKGKDKKAKDMYGINGPKGHLPEDARKIFRNHVAIVNESLRTLLREDEEGKAKAITAASDMVNDFTTWMQRVGQYQTKSMIELADTIRGEFGQAESETFKQAVAPALQATLETMTQQREAISHAVAVLAGEASGEAMGGMGGGEVPDMTGGADEFAKQGNADSMNTRGDEFGASDAAAGGMETSGRELRESRKREQVRRKIAESQALMAILSQK